jgi:hypothetical protein
MVKNNQARCGGISVNKLDVAAMYPYTSPSGLVRIVIKILLAFAINATPFPDFFHSP